MRALLFHCKDYRTKIGKLADRPVHILPESVEKKELLCSNCVVALVTVEEGDNQEIHAPHLAREIQKMGIEVKEKAVVILPFAHLSNNLGSSFIAKQILENTKQILQDQNFLVIRDHFGSHKELLLDIYGHPGNARYREF